jgi:hypothetical protein
MAAQVVVAKKTAVYPDVFDSHYKMIDRARRAQLAAAVTGYR